AVQRPRQGAPGDLDLASHPPPRIGVRPSGPPTTRRLLPLALTPGPGPLNGASVEITTRTLNDLAFGEILRALGARCRTDAGRRRSEGRPFLETRTEVEAALALVAEARRLSGEQFTLPFGALPDVKDSVPRAAKG